VRILFVSQYFAPEITAASLRLEPLAAGLARRGHDVEVLCEAPSHPRGVVPAEFRRRLVTRRDAEGYRVSHVWVTSSESKRARTRLASYGSFAASATIVGAAMRRPDVVVASSPPLSVGVVGAALAARHRVPLVLDVRDLWPQVAAALGELPPGRVLRTAESVERHLYARAAAVTTPTEPFRRHIADLAVRPDKVTVLPNGTTKEWIAAGSSEPSREAAGFPEDRFVWTYAGNIGLSQDLGMAIEAARLLGDGYQLLLLGDGTAREQLREQAGDLDGGSVVFRSSVPPEEAQVIMRASDALVVILADVAALSKTVPVKLYDSCAVGRPVILAANGESRRLSEERGAALTLNPGDPAALANAVRRLRDEPGIGEALVQEARRFAEESLRERGVPLLEGILEEAAAGGGDG
jgi:glycosyltransferase involved in cell wall biosynthesis